MKLEERVEVFSGLGSILRNILDGKETSIGKRFLSLIENQYKTNPWFTAENVRMAVSAIAEKLTGKNLSVWTGNYPSLEKEYRPLNVGVIMAGNIPLAGFHDFMTTLISGNRIIAKTSSKDSELIRYISEIICKINGSFREMVVFAEGTLSGFDCVIATGSDNSSRYFEYYFGKYPSIIRKNRNSVAVIEGDESDIDFKNLGQDIFSYFGLGCRNVSKIYLPEGFDFARMFRNWNDYSAVINNIKYANNYDYNKAVMLVNREKFLDTGYILLKEDSRISSPVSMIHFQYYSTQDDVKREIQSQSEKIQCIVSKKDIRFGMSQSPELWDYADNIDTLDFLLKINTSGIL
jgi:hypothetical protein